MRAQTKRSRLKAARRDDILHAAARLFADHGFRSVSIEDLGAAVGVSGPAVYRHFTNKEAILSDLLVKASKRLLEGGNSQTGSGDSPREVLERLVAFHTDFALTDSDLIRIQDRDFGNLAPQQAKTVRRLQRAYVEVWVEALLRFDPTTPVGIAQAKAHATFGLLNSTPHSAADREIEVNRRTLECMAMAALLSNVNPDAPIRTSPTIGS